MTEVTSLTLAVDSRQVRSAVGDLDKLSTAGTRTEKATEGVRNAFRSLSGVLAGVAVADIGRRAIQQADAYAGLNARLKLVTNSTTEFVAAQKELFAISQQTGTGLEQTSDLFGSLSRSTESLGVSQTKVLEVTRTINQALAVSGTSAQSAQAALTQLGQGFAAGALRGEELNSVLEQAPRLARAIADGLGVSIGQLRQLGQDGKLTAEAVFQALQRSAGAIDAEFNKLPLTVERASTQAGNALLKLIGTLDQATGSTSTLAGVVQGAAGFFSELADEINRVREGQESASLLANAFVTAVEALQVFGANVKFVFQGVGREIGAIAAQIVALARLDITGFRAISDAVKEDGVRARAELDALERRILNRVPLPDLGQSDRRELARRGRGGAAFGSASTIDTSPKPGRVRAIRGPREEAPNLQVTQELQDALSRLEATDLNKISRLRDELKQLLELKANGSTDTRLDAAIADATAELEKMNPAFAASEERAKRLNELLGATPTAQLEAVREDIRLLNAEFEAGRLTVEQYNEAVNARLGNDKPVTSPNGEVDEIRKNLISGTQNIFADTLENLGTKGFRNFGDQFHTLLLRLSAEAVAANLTKKLFGEDGKGLESIGQTVTDQLNSVDFSKIGQSLSDVFSSLASSVSGLFGGSGGGGFDFASVFAGFFADGGFASPNKLAVVGERGPELIHTGNRGLTIQPLSFGSQAANKTVNAPITVNVSGQVDRRTALQIAAAAQRGVAAGSRNL